MMLRRASLAKRIFLPTLGLFVFSIAAVLTVQHKLYVNSFEKTLTAVQGGTLDMNRAAAEGLMHSVRLATERMLQTGEQTGSLDATMERVAEHYETAATTSIHHMAVMALPLGVIGEYWPLVIP